ncbi:MAG: GntR family transcriptional regulator [Anaerolineales bacterium]|nr:GntR family transcriptional regulator [Anaerolineales bacterium]
MHPKITHLASSVPLYIQIAEKLISQIEDGQLLPGDKLPTERELSTSLEVQRATVRQAFSVLEDRGLIIRKRGSGTYVAEAKIEREATQLFAFTKIMTDRGYKTGAKVVSCVKIEASSHTAKVLQIAAGDPIYYYHRLRLLNDEPLMLEKIQLPASVFPDFDSHDLERHSLFEIMEKEYGRVVTTAEQALEAVRASEYEAGILDVQPGAALMMEERASRDQYGAMVEFSRDLYRGDRFRFVVENARFDIEIK